MYSRNFLASPHSTGCNGIAGKCFNIRPYSISVTSFTKWRQLCPVLLLTAPPLHRVSLQPRLLHAGLRLGNRQENTLLVHTWTSRSLITMTYDARYCSESWRWMTWHGSRWWQQFMTILKVMTADDNDTWQVMTVRWRCKITYSKTWRWAVMVDDESKIWRQLCKFRVTWLEGVLVDDEDLRDLIMLVGPL